MSNGNLLYSNPIMRTALAELARMGGRATVPTWFGEHPDLKDLDKTERGRIVRKLHDAGYIQKTGERRTVLRKCASGKTGTGVQVVWRLKE